jgi:2-phosphoglycerate kinase
MINVCYNCGENRVDKTIDPSGPFAVCPLCGHKHPFLQLPLLIVAGASGTGKSAVCQKLLGRLTEAVLLEGDLLWRPEFNKPEEGYRAYHEAWLRLGKSIAQSGRSVVLFNAGAIPENVEPCQERRYFSAVHYLGLVCDEEELAERLRKRPAWRQSSSQAYIEKHVKFNQWFKENADKTSPVIELFNTSGLTVAESASQVTLWIRAKVS